MLGIPALLIFIFLSFKFSLKLTKDKPFLIEKGISKPIYTCLFLSPYLYILSLFSALYSFTFIPLFIAILISLILAVPGIALGHKVYNDMDRLGTDVAERAGKQAGNIKSLGIFVIIFIISNLAISFLIINGSA